MVTQLMFDWQSLKRRDMILTPEGDFKVCRVRDHDVVCTNGVKTLFIPDLAFYYCDVLIEGECNAG